MEIKCKIGKTKTIGKISECELIEKGVRRWQKCTCCTKTGISIGVAALGKTSVIGKNHRQWTDKFIVKFLPIRENTLKINKMEFVTISESPRADAADIVGKTRCFQYCATGECGFSDEQNTLRNVYSPQTGAATEGIGADGL